MFRELRATAPQTYYTFRTSNGTVDVVYVLLISLTALGYKHFVSKREKMRRHSKHRGWYMDVQTFFVKTAADVRQQLRRPSVSPQTCDKKKLISRSEFLWAQQKLRLHWFYWCFRVFHRFKKTILLDNAIKKNSVCRYVWSKRCIEKKELKNE